MTRLHRVLLRRVSLVLLGVAIGLVLLALLASQMGLVRPVPEPTSERSQWVLGLLLVGLLVVAGVVVVFSDITEENRVLQEYAAMTDLLDRTGQMAKVGGWEYDLRHKRFLWSQEVCRIHELDYTPTLEEGLALFVPSSRPVIDAAFKAAVDDGISYDLELQKVTAKGRPIWVRLQGHAVQENGKTVLLRGAIHDITERKAMQDKLLQMAFYDPLTQLPNRNLLTDRLNQAVAAKARSGGYGAIMVLDLDHFKMLNDTHGHLAGDSLLIEVASRLKQNIREVDTVARFGGDEFVIILGQLSHDRVESLAQATRVAEKIRQHLAQPYQLTLHQPDQTETVLTHLSTASIGVIVFSGRVANAIDFFKWADSAMYKAKGAGRDAVHVHDQVLG